MEKVYGKAVSGGQVMGKIILLRRKKINEEDDVRSSEEEIERLKKAVAVVCSTKIEDSTTKTHCQLSARAARLFLKYIN